MKLTVNEIKKIIEEFDIDDAFDIETEHRKGSSFYATGTYEFAEDDIPQITNFLEKDCSSLIGSRLLVSGTWSEDDGTDWFVYEQQFKNVTVVPEKTIVVPEHEQVTWL